MILNMLRTRGYMLQELKQSILNTFKQKGNTMTTNSDPYAIVPTTNEQQKLPDQVEASNESNKQGDPNVDRTQTVENDSQDKATPSLVTTIIDTPPPTIGHPEAGNAKTEQDESNQASKEQSKLRQPPPPQESTNKEELDHTQVKQYTDGNDGDTQTSQPEADDLLKKEQELVQQLAEIKAKQEEQKKVAEEHQKQAAEQAKLMELAKLLGLDELKQGLSHMRSQLQQALDDQKRFSELHQEDVKKQQQLEEQLKQETAKQQQLETEHIKVIETHQQTLDGLSAAMQEATKSTLNKLHTGLTTISTIIDGLKSDDVNGQKDMLLNAANELNEILTYTIEHVKKPIQITNNSDNSATTESTESAENAEVAAPSTSIESDDTDDDV